ncbi:hypothetical protein TgHK011_009122 [Trichoderma gracile]|nr:hypothetical protein TgHK011_009122 [Trichoderma gracile]
MLGYPSETAFIQLRNSRPFVQVHASSSTEGSHPRRRKNRARETSSCRTLSSSSPPLSLALARTPLRRTYMHKQNPQFVRYAVPREEA